MKSVADQTKPSSGDEIDVLLGDFFKGEMPKPWPAFQPPRRQTLPFRPRKPRPFALTSRLALVAAALLLMAFGWMLADGISPTVQNRDPGIRFKGPGTANPIRPHEDFAPDFVPAPKGSGNGMPSINFKD